MLVPCEYSVEFLPSGGLVLDYLNTPRTEWVHIEYPPGTPMQTVTDEVLANGQTCEVPDE